MHGPKLIINFRLNGNFKVMFVLKITVIFDLKPQYQWSHLLVMTNLFPSKRTVDPIILVVSTVLC